MMVRFTSGSFKQVYKCYALLLIMKAVLSINISKTVQLIIISIEGKIKSCQYLADTRYVIFA